MSEPVVILLAEDHGARQVKESLERKIAPHIPAVQVDYVETIDAGREKIRHYAAMPFCAILDYMLPEKHPGQAATGDRSLCVLLRDRWRGSQQPFIIHVSAYGSQEDLKRHIEEAHRGHFDQKTAIEKDELGEWIEFAAQSILQRYFEEKLSRSVSLVLPREASSADLDSSFAREAPRAASITMALVDLTLEVSARWPFLSDEFKDKLRKVFDVDEAVTPVMVDLKRSANLSQNPESR